MLGIELIIGGSREEEKRGGGLVMLAIIIEILYIGIILLTISSSINLDDIIGQLFGLYLIIITGIESAIGLGIIIGYYRIRGTALLD